MLIGKGADFNVFLTNGDSDATLRPLHLATRLGNLSMAQVLLSHGANPNGRGGHGWTPLFSAAMKVHTQIAEILIAKDATVNTVDENGITPLHVVAMRGQRAS